MQYTWTTDLDIKLLIVQEKRRHAVPPDASVHHHLDSGQRDQIWDCSRVWTQLPFCRKEREEKLGELPCGYAVNKIQVEGNCALNILCSSTGTVERGTGDRKWLNIHVDFVFKKWVLPGAYCVNDKTVTCKKRITVKARQWFVGREMVLFGMGHVEAHLGAWQSSISWFRWGFQRCCISFLLLLLTNYRKN